MREHSAVADIKPAMFTLLYNSIVFNVKYFFTAPSAESNQKLLCVLKLFSDSFAQTDVNVFKQNLEALELLNNKTDLYRRNIFLENIWFPSMKLLMDTLISKSHHLLHDQITLVVFNMASVNLDVFYHQFIPGYMKQSSLAPYSSILIPLLGTERDYPSFVTGLNRFLNDGCFYLHAKR